MFEEVNLILCDTESFNFQEVNSKMKNNPIILPTRLHKEDNVLYVINDSKTQKNIGVVCLYDINLINQNACIEGFVIDNEYTSKLIVSYIKLIYHGMTEMNLNKIYAKHLIGDNYYKRIYDFLRFTLEGNSRDEVKYLGKFYSVQVRSLLKYEFNRYYLSGNHINKMCRLEGF